MSVRFRSWLAPRFERFVALKRAGGAKYVAQERHLKQFDVFLRINAPSAPLRRDTLLAFLAGLDRLSLRGRDNVVSVVWQALHYAQAHGARMEQLPPRPATPPSWYRLRPPRLITADEIRLLLGVARQLTSRTRTGALQGATYATLFGLLWTTGIRIGEAVALDIGDIDDSAGLLTIHRGKFDKTRVLPLKASVVAALSRYVNDPRRLVGRHASAPLFVSARQRRLSKDMAHHTFGLLCERVGMSKPLPSPHHLRHSFTVLRIVSWYRADRDVNALLPALSTYLGHASVQNTRAYLQQNGLLLEEACKRFRIKSAALDELLS